LVDGIKVKPRRPFRLTNSAGFVSSREKKNMIGKDVGKENDTGLKINFIIQLNRK